MSGELRGKLLAACLVGCIASLLASAALSGENVEPEAGPPPVRLPQELTLRDAFLLALRANKDIRVAWLGTDVADARIMSARGAFDPTLFAEAARGRSETPIEDDPPGRTKESVGSVSAGIRQRLVSGTNLELAASDGYGRDRSNGEPLNPEHDSEVFLALRQDLLKDFGVRINRTDIVIAQNNLLISREDLRDQVILNLFLVEQAYWDLYFAVADLKVREQQLARAQKLVDRAEAQVGVGEAAPIEVTRAKSSAAAQAVAILNARNRISTLRNRLLRLMGIIGVSRVRDDFVLVDPPPTELYRTTLEETRDVARQYRPDYRRALLAIENAELAERFARNQRLPTLQLFGQYGLAGLGESFGSSADEIEDRRFRSWRAGLLFEWPFPNRTARGNYRAATFQRRIAQARRDSVLEQIVRGLADALDDLRTAEGRIETAEEARLLAEQLLRAEEKSFSLGRSNSLDVLDAQAALAAAERDEVLARTDYASALANLFRVQGDFLQRKGVALLEGRPY